MPSTNQPHLVEALRVQADWGERLDSPLYHALLSRIANDVRSSGICWEILEPHADAPQRSVLPLRFLAAIHRLVLDGQLPRLARFYPSVGGTANPEEAWRALLAELQQHREAIGNRIPPSVQTNEVARCCALLPGFLNVARQTGLPLRLLEIGCSAGLNLRWDHYRYETGHGAWGDIGSPVVFRGNFVNDLPPLDTAVRVIERYGCDLNPLDVTSEEGRLTLLSFAWPDQTERLLRLANAIDVVRRVPATLERADALDWLERQLAKPRAGTATIVFHSIVLLYLTDGARARLVELLSRAGERASAEAPLAWLGMETGGKETEVHLTLWPGNHRTRIATAGYHGRDVELVPEMAHAGEDHREA
jgi:hypothetical protein